MANMLQFKKDLAKQLEHFPLREVVRSLSRLLEGAQDAQFGRTRAVPPA